MLSFRNKNPDQITASKSLIHTRQDCSIATNFTGDSNLDKHVAVGVVPRTLLTMISGFKCTPEAELGRLRSALAGHIRWVTNGWTLRLHVVLGVRNMDRGSENGTRISVDS